MEPPRCHTFPAESARTCEKRLALVGTVRLTVLLMTGVIFDVLNVLHGLIPATRLLTSFIYAFAGLSAAVFLAAFHKAPA